MVPTAVATAVYKAVFFIWRFILASVVRIFHRWIGHVDRVHSGRFLARPNVSVLYFHSDEKYTRLALEDSEVLICKPIQELIAELDPH